jgi:rod shape-determining protein MreD
LRWLITAQLILLLLAVQVAWMPHVVVFDAAPDVMLILVVQLAFTLTPTEAFTASWASGMLRDLRGAEAAGTWALLYGLLALMIARARQKDSTTHLGSRVLTVLLSSSLLYIGLYVIRIFRGYSLGWIHLKEAFLGTLYTTLVSLVLLPVLAFLLKRIHAPR